MDVKINHKLFWILVSFILGLSADLPGQEINIIWQQKKAIGVIIEFESALNLPKENEIKILLEGKKDAILLNTKIRNDKIILEPIVPFTNGKNYSLFIKGERHTISVNNKELVNIKIDEVFPKSKSLPSNLLKMRLSFSGPMSHLNSKEYIKVYKNNSDISTYPFLELDNELWNDTHDELTLWLDPGRIKKGLLSKKNRGENLLPGDQVELVIMQNWPDINGNYLDREYQFSYSIVEADICKPETKDWDIFTPEAGSKKPLSILLKEEFDGKLIANGINIQDGEKIIAGQFVLKKKGKALFFYPKETWEFKKYQIIIDPKIEDLAGNNFLRLFDEDLIKKRNKENQDPIINFKTLPKH